MFFYCLSTSSYFKRFSNTIKIYNQLQSIISIEHEITTQLNYKTDNMYVSSSHSQSIESNIKTLVTRPIGSPFKEKLTSSAPVIIEVLSLVI